MNLGLKHRKENNMTQEEKELLLKDLFARLPYGAFVQFEVDGQKTIKPLTVDFLSSTWYHTEFIKPYLRPMSSMTEEEKIIYQSKQSIIFDFKNNKLYVDNYYSLDYLNSIHIDYRGLIEKGLALEAPEGMYNDIITK